MIDLNELLYALNEYLGRDKFALYLGTNGAPDKNETRVVGTVNIGRVPYAFSTDQIDAESLNITFTFDLPCGTDADDLRRDLAVATIGERLLAWRKIKLQYVDGSVYHLNTFFEMLPMGNPYVDNGHITQQLVVSGKALLQNAKCGAWLGNNERVLMWRLDDNNPTPLLVLDKASSTTASHDSQMNLSGGGLVPQMQAIAYTNTVKLTCLYMGTDLDARLWQIGEGYWNDPNELYGIRTEKVDADGNSAFIGEKVCKLMSVSNVTSAGVFSRFEVTLQMVEW